VAAEQREIDECADVVDGVVVFGDAQRPAELRPRSKRVRMRKLGDELSWDAGGTLRVFERVWFDTGAIRFEAACGPVDEIPVF
jgi:hypothetical protein